MEKNFIVRAIRYPDETGNYLLESYRDVELNREVQVGETLNVTGKRAKELIDKGLVKLIRVKRGGSIE